MKKICLVLIMLVVYLQKNFAITVSGIVLLESNNNNSGVTVIFERVAPSTLIYSCYTDSLGYYIHQIETGIYKISYSKENYLTTIMNNQSLYADSVFVQETLNKKGNFIFVPEDATTIQEAINIASNNDTIIVDEGIYKENIDFKGMKIVLASRFLLNNDTSFISRTVIYGNYNGHVISFKNYETNESKLIGLKIVNGKASFNVVGGDYNSTCGGGIYCIASSPTLSNLIIEK